MDKILQSFADNLLFQAHSLYEQSDEFPDRKPENDAASKEVTALEQQFRNGEVNEDLARQAHLIVGDEYNRSGHAVDVYDVALRHIGFDSHYESADHFLFELIEAIGHGPVEQFA